MPDFDTRSPQEPNQPSNINMTRRLGIGVSILLLAVVAVVITVGAVMRYPQITYQAPADPLDQELQPTPTPAYDVVLYTSAGPLYCEDSGAGCHRACDRGLSYCNEVSTEATGARKLASITEDAAVPNADAQSLTFYDASYFDLSIIELVATCYCFVDKDVAVSVLRGALDKAELLGKTDNCHIAVYEGSGPDLK